MLFPDVLYIAIYELYKSREFLFTMHSVDMIFKTVLIIGVLCFFVDLSSSRKLKVIGGYDIDIKDIPYHVSIQIKADADKPRFSFCGGTILDKNLIITAGHCITNVR